MSYEGFKSVLGETSLERKCRWWFGIFLGMLLFLSFYWYSQRMEQVVHHGDRKVGPELVRAAWLEAHFNIEGKLDEQAAMEAGGGTIDPQVDQSLSFYHDVMESSKQIGRVFRWYAILPPNPQGLNAPQYKYEEKLLNECIKAGPFLGDEALDPSRDPLSLSPGHIDRRVVVDGKQVYRYYAPLYADSSCVLCHRTLGAVSRPKLKEGDLMAVVRVEIDQEQTQKLLAKNNSLLWLTAVVIGFLSMFLLYFIVRYVIVKPVQHLRDVSNAVREGDVEQRAEIHTGDEFEELAAAFNRMLRRLLRQQDALKEVNEELDGKIDQLAQANMRLFETNRAKSDFLATMSHELRTPLNSILGFSDVLGSIDALDDKQKRYVANIQRSGRTLLEMINDILDLAKMESGKMDLRPAEFRIDAVVVAQCDMARPLTEKKNIDLETLFDADLPFLRQDQAKVQQILNNLLSNAIKFTPEGGRIVVAAKRGSQGRLYLTVSDTGVGMNKEDQAIVFEKFRQGSSAAPRGEAITREHSGTGLGLSIVRELCHLLGGEVSLDSTPGKGSTFSVRLPWRLSITTDMEADLQRGVAELTRPSAPPTVARSGS